MKKSWEKPEMIVLVRRKSDEIILASCKMSSGGASITDGACEVRTAPDKSCDPCSN